MEREQVGTIRTGSLAASAARAEHPQLTFDVERIARLDLDGRDAARDQRIEPERGRRSAARSSDAAFVAFTVETIPPPALAISS